MSVVCRPANPGEHLAARLRARDVADRNRDSAAACGDLAERRRADGRAKRGEERGAGILERRAEPRLDDRDALVGDIDVEPVGAVIEPDAHRAIILTA